MKARTLFARIFALILALCVLLTLSACKKKRGEEPDITDPGVTVDTPENEPTVPSAALSGNVNPLTGLAGYDEEKAGQKPVAIVVENHPQARPQFGMSTPDIVMEYEVEGGISRMLWLYANADLVPEKVGPVRSARHDIVELARGLDAVFVHAGGSTEADQLLSSYNGALAEIDGLTRDYAFSRDQSRNVSLEHTLVLNGTRLREQIANLGLNTTADDAHRTPFRFASKNTPRTLTGGDADHIHFEYSANYAYDFTLDPGTGNYVRTLNGKTMTDDQGTICDYTNVLVLYVEMQSRNDKQGHQDLKLENGGKGLYLNGGKYEEITWKKGADVDPLVLLTADGEILTLNPGNSYIGFVRSTQESKSAF